MFHLSSSAPRRAASCAAAVTALAAALLAGAASAQEIRIAALQAADAVVLYAAADEKLFEAQGLDVKVIPFKSALEVGAAMRANRLDGHFADLMNVFTQNATGISQAVILTTTHTNPEQRAFGLCVSPAYSEKLPTLDALKASKNVDMAMSSSTIIDYLADRMKDSAGLPKEVFKNIEVKPIPIRLQMLLTGKAATALLPEPLVSVVESKGGKVIWDDRKLDEPLAVVSLKKSLLDDKTVEGFRRAVAEAAKRIEADPEKYRAYMVKKGLLPAAAAKGYKMVRFSIYGSADGLPPLPSAEDVKRVGGWMVQKGMIKTEPVFEDVVWTPKR